MRLLEQHNCADYLRESELIGRGEEVSIQLLAGGVSNVVFHVTRPAEFDDFVLKQARGQLRVEQPWFCSVERIWREVEVLRLCCLVLQNRAGVESRTSSAWESQATVLVPEVLFEDRDNYVFAMTAAPPGHATWKEELMAGQFDEHIAIACGQLLGRLHAGTWNDTSIAEQFGDRQYFFDLRVEPYYRSVAGVHADLRDELEELIASLDEHRRCLVHGDFSPKNLLVWNQPKSPVMLIDCEGGHYGDGAFDLGFLLSHLVLKAIFHLRQGVNIAAGPLALVPKFWSAYEDVLRPAISRGEFDLLQQRVVKNLAGCLLARVDGKSPVDYLKEPSQQETARKLARSLFQLPPGGLTEAFDVVAQELRKS